MILVKSYSAFSKKCAYTLMNTTVDVLNSVKFSGYFTFINDVEGLTSVVNSFTGNDTLLLPTVVRDTSGDLILVVA